MHKSQVEALLSLRSEICNDLIVNYVIFYLTKCEILTDKERDYILSSGESIGSINSPQFREEVLNEQTKTFLNLLIEKVEKISDAYDKFIIILLKDDNYPWIAKKLELIHEEICIKEKCIELEALKAKNVLTSGHLVHDVPNKVKNLLHRNGLIENVRRQLNELAQKGYGWLVLYGMGGSGKSIVAAEAVREWNCHHIYSDGIWWTNCGQMTSEDNKFDTSLLLIKMQFLWDRFCEHSNNKEKHQKFECIESATNKLKSFLKTHRKCLIILDDVWNREVLEKFDLGVPVLYTTRDKSIIPYNFSGVSFVQTVDHDNYYALSIEESRQLLALWVKSSANELNNKYVNRIIEKVKGNPLCLTLIGNTMEDYGNDLGCWKFYFKSIKNINQIKSPKRRSFGCNSVYESFGFNILVERSWSALKEEMRNHYKYFSLFLEDIRIPIKVFEVLWMKSQYEVNHIMDGLVNKSLVMKNKTNSLTLYTVHDIILNFLKIQCENEIEELHGELLDSYFSLCKTETGQLDYSKLPNDGYIYYFLGYHIYKANRHQLFAQIFLNLSFVVNKIRYTGPNDLLNDYFNYKKHFDQFITQYKDYVRFVSTNVDLLCDINIDVIQLALCQPIHSQVYKNGLTLINTTDKLYLKWCNQSNVKTCKLLSTKLHSGSVRFAVFSPKKSIVASVGSDQIVRIWDSNTGKQLKTMKGHENSINCCEFNSDGSLLITASDDGTVKIWEMDQDTLFCDGTMKSPRPRSGSQYPFLINGNAQKDDSINTYSEHLIQQNDIQVKCCSFSHNNQLIISGGSDLIARVWSLNSMITKHILKGHKHTVQSCKFSFDSELIITASSDEVLIWCAIKAQILKTLKHKMVVKNCLFSEKGFLKHIYTSSGRYVYKWSSSGKEEPICHYKNLNKSKYYVTYCTVSPNGKYIAAGTTTDQIIIWLSDLFSYIAATFNGSDRITCINFNSDSTQLLSCSQDGNIIIWDTSKVFSASMVGLRKKFSVQNYKPNIIKVLTPDNNGFIRLYEGFEGKENKSLVFRPKLSQTYDITCCALSTNLDILFGTSEGQLIFHDSSDKDETYFLQNHTKEVTFCIFINNNKFLTASKDSTLRIYDKFSRKFDSPLYEVKENDELITKEVIMGPIINCKIFSRESKILVWCENGSLLVIDLLKNRLIARCNVDEGSQINCADVTYNEELISTVSSDKSIILWRSHISDSLNANDIYSIRIIKTDCCPRSCRFSPNGNFLVIGDDNGKIKICNFYGTESNCLQVFNDCHSGWVNHIAISPKSNLIISLSKSIKLWDKNGNLLQTFKTNGGLMSDIYTHFVDNNDENDFNTIVTVDDAGVLYILQLLNFQD